MIAPHHHDHGNPLPCAKAGQRQIARHLEKEISREKDSGPQAIDFIAESQLPFHLEGGEPDIDSIQISDDIKKKKEGQQPPRKLGDDFSAEINSSERWHKGNAVPQLLISDPHQDVA